MSATTVVVNDDALHALVEAETAAREAADTALSNTINQRENESLDRDSDLSAHIDAEQTDRIASVAALAGLLDTEAQDRADADVALEADATAKADAAAQDAKNYADSIIVGLFRDTGNWDASVGTWPTTGSGTAGAIRRGDSYTVSVAGSISGHAFDVGDVFRATVNNPGQVSANWGKFEASTDQATEAERGTVKEATQATVEDALTVEQTTYVSPRKLWMAFVKSWTVSGFLSAVRGTLLTGLVTSDNSDVLATDSIIIGIGKLKRRLNDLLADAAGFGALITGHISDTANPHGVTKAQVGLGLADNTTDASKPISTLTQAALDTKQPLSNVNTLTGNHTLALTDAECAVLMNVASANNCEIPLNSTVAFRIGTQIKVFMYGAGQTTITAVGGVTIRTFGSWVKIAGQYLSVTLTKVGANEWIVEGNTVP
jgi:hypothetical protein